MKYLLVLVFIAYIALTQAISEQDARKLREDCIEETSVDFFVVSNATNHGDFVDDEKLNNFFTCFFKKLEFTDEAGKYDAEKTKSVITTLNNKDVAELVEDCMETSGGDGTSETIKLAKCIQKSLPRPGPRKY